MLTESDSRQILDVEVRYVLASPTNPRRSFPKGPMEELATSIRERGVREPVTMRIHPKQADHFELVHGERRWRGSKIAGKDTIPAILIDATDQEVLELQLLEHALHEDLSPLEEGAAYENLHKRFGVPVASIAKKIGRSATYVYGRLALCRLTEESKKAFVDGKVSLDAAQVLARVPQKLQPKALEDILEEYGFDLENAGAITGETARTFVKDHYMLKLADAPFDRGDADLVKKAGPCTTCPKRTGNQRELFADIESPDLCVDLDCHREKVDAWWERQKADATSKGKAILSGAEAKKVFSGDHIRHESRFVDLKDHNYTDPKTRTWGEILGKNKPPVTLARDEDGKVHELVAKEEAGLALKKIGGAAAKLAPAKKREADPHTARMQRESAIRRSAADKAMGLLVAAAEKRGATLEVLRAIVVGLIREVWADRAKAVAQRRLLEGKKETNALLLTKHVNHHKTLKTHAATLKLPGLVALGVELVASRDAYSVHHTDREGDALAMSCEALGVNWQKCLAEAKAERAEKDKGKGKPAKATKPAKKKKR